MAEIVKTAVLKVKSIRNRVNPESVSFENYISSSRTSIKIDFPDGKSFMEKGFRSIEMPIDKFYIEFFEYDQNQILDYLLNKNSNYRATSVDGTILRLSHKDEMAVLSDSINDDSDKKLREFEFVDEKESLFQKIKRMIHKKDN